MSGIFLSVWPVNIDKLSLLQPTKGGWPHVTLFYSGSYFSVDTLVNSGFKVFQNCVKTQLTLRPENVVVNEFVEGSTNKTRYDVLMRLDNDGVNFINKQLGVLGVRDNDNVFTSYPHITHSIHYTRESAENTQQQVKSQLKDNLIVEITGYTID